jgi:hypothetical protein
VEYKSVLGTSSSLLVLGSHETSKSEVVTAIALDEPTVESRHLLTWCCLS